MKEIKSFARRKGKALGESKQELYDNFLPKIRINLNNGQITKETLFSDKLDNKLYLEIGFGSGEHLAHQAKLNPNNNYIGCEPFINGVMSLVYKISSDNLSNVRILDDDVYLLLDKLQDNILDGVYILFPDPWPKKRHNKRRIISNKLLGLIAKKIKIGGFILAATDIDDYAEWIIMHFSLNENYEWEANKEEDFLKEPDNWIKTKYQKKAIEENRRSYFLKFIRKNKEDGKAN